MPESCSLLQPGLHIQLLGLWGHPRLGVQLQPAQVGESGAGMSDEPFLLQAPLQSHPGDIQGLGAGRDVERGDTVSMGRMTGGLSALPSSALCCHSSAYTCPLCQQLPGCTGWVPTLTLPSPPRELL